MSGNATVASTLTVMNWASGEILRHDYASSNVQPERPPHCGWSMVVDDAAAAVVAALELPAGVYNVTDDEPLRMREYAQAISEATGAPADRRVPIWLFKLIGGGPANYLLRSQRLSRSRRLSPTSEQQRLPAERQSA